MYSSRTKVSVREFLSSFKNWPRIFKLLINVNRRYFIFISGISLIQAVIPTLVILITQQLINSVMNSTSKNFDNVIYYFSLLVMISIVKGILGSCYTYYYRIYQSLLTYELNVKLMQKAATLTLEDFENPDVYDKLQRAQNEIGTRPFEVYSSIMTIFVSLITFVSTATILILWKWWIVLVLLIFPLVTTFYSFGISKKEFTIQQKRAPRMRKSWYYSFLMTKDISYKEVKLFDLGDYIIAKYKDIFLRYLKVDKKLIKKLSIISLLFSLVSDLLGDLITLYIIWCTFTGEITVANLISYTKSISLVESSYQQFLNTILGIYKDNLYIKQLFDFLDYESRKVHYKIKPNKVSLDKIETIEFKNVSFKYQNTKKYALKNVSFKIKAGEIIGIVGENGSGKTTLIKILSKLYQVEEGEILINNISINEYTDESLRSRMGVIFQDFIKYELTAKENIGYGDIYNLKNKSQLINAIERAGADEIINNLPYGLNSQLGNWFSDGNQLSGGQWQRIAISRAFIRDADLYVLDEPSSALDPISEKDIFDRFFKLAKNKIGLFTSHRFSSVKYADNILVFRDGLLVEQGNHSQLMDLGGYYKKLYNIQANPFRICS